MEKTNRNLMVDGIVLKYTNFGEADRMITILSPKLGKLSVLAKGCRKHKSKYLPSTELFTYSNYTLYSRRDYNILTHASVVETFYDIRNDIEKLIYGSYILNLAEELSVPNQEGIEFFYILLQTLNLLTYSEIIPRNLTKIFEIKILHNSGYMPFLDSCIICQEEKTNYFFDVAEGVLICHECNKDRNNKIEISLGTIKTFMQIININLRQIKDFKIPKYALIELDRMLDAHILYILGKNLKTRQFIRDFNKEQ